MKKRNCCLKNIEKNGEITEKRRNFIKKIRIFIKKISRLSLIYCILLQLIKAFRVNTDMKKDKLKRISFFVTF